MPYSQDRPGKTELQHATQSGPARKGTMTCHTKSGPSTKKDRMPHLWDTTFIEVTSAIIVAIASVITEIKFNHRN